MLIRIYCIHGAILRSSAWRRRTGVSALDIKGENDPHNADIAPGILQAHDYANVFIIASLSILTSFSILRFTPLTLLAD